MENKDFDCVEMKRAAQAQIRARVEGMTPEHEIAFFREAGRKLERQIEAARAVQGKKSATVGGPASTG